MTFIYKSPPPISPALELPDGWLIFYWGDPLERIARGEGKISAQVVSLAHQKVLNLGSQMQQWLQSKRLEGGESTALYLNLHAQYQRGAFIVSERPELAQMTLIQISSERSLFQQGIKREGQEELRCLQVCPTQHDPHALNVIQFALSISPSVSLGSRHPFWLKLLEVELSVLAPKLSPLHTEVGPEPTDHLSSQGGAELLLTRGEGGLSLYSRRLKSYLVERGALQERAWGRWLLELERVSGLPLKMLSEALSTELLQGVESLEGESSGGSSVGLPQIRDSLYTMNYEDAPSEYPPEEPSVPSLTDDDTQPPSAESGAPQARQELARGFASSTSPSPHAASAYKEPNAAQAAKSLHEHIIPDVREDDDESSIFTDISLSDVSLTDPLIRQDELTPPDEASESEQKLQEQLERSAPIKLTPSSSFDLEALNLSDSDVKPNSIEGTYQKLPPLKPVEDDDEGPKTFNDFGRTDTMQQDVTRDLSLADFESLQTSLSGGETNVPTRVDLDRQSVEHSIARIDDESPTTMEAPPELNSTSPSHKKGFMQTSDYHSGGAPSGGLGPPSFHGSIHDETTQVSDQGHKAHDEEATKKMDLNAIKSAIQSSDSSERRRSLSDVMKRFKPQG